MATYNGEKYLKQQFNSLLKQTYQDFRILVRDDGSTDNTIAIIEGYAKRYPEKIIYIQDKKKGGSAAKNFFYLISYASADYIMFCDQDDIWLPDKIDKTYKKMLAIECSRGKKEPVLVFSTYKPVDEKLKPIYLKEKNNQISAYNLDFNHLLVQNYVTGCLMMCNKALYSNCGDFDDGILMHDWWLALLASSTGTICHIPDIMMLYRQHNNNEVGCVDVKSFRYRLSKFLDKDTRNKQYLYLAQAELFYKRYSDILDANAKKQLTDFISIYRQSSKLKRMYGLIKGCYLKSDVVKIIGQLLYI